MSLGGLLVTMFSGGRLGPPPVDLPTWNPQPGSWSDGHARNMAYRYRAEVAPMYRGRPTWPDYSQRWDTQPAGSLGCSCSACAGGGQR